MIHLCETCGKDMGNCSPSRKYCSPGCERKARKIRAAEKKSGNIRPKICPVCGKEFIPKRNEKYCSPECFLEHKREYDRKRSKIKWEKLRSGISKTGICKHCGKEFVKKSERQKYCTKECRFADEAEKEKKLRRERDAKKPMLICPICGKEFPQGVNKNKKYCSDACRKKANFPDQRVEKICPVCGKWFYPAGRQKYCSEECRVRAKLVKKKRGMTRLAYEAAEATALGVSYGKYKAMKAG